MQLVLLRMIVSAAPQFASVWLVMFSIVTSTGTPSVFHDPSNATALSWSFDLTMNFWPVGMTAGTNSVTQLALLTHAQFFSTRTLRGSVRPSWRPMYSEVTTFLS